jgi:hypothetical protein
VKGEHQSALTVYSQILAGDPGNAVAHYYAGQLLLAKGYFQQGWAECEWRPQEAMPPSISRWTGETLKDATLLICGEQGYGDSINFARYAALAKPLVSEIVLGTLPGIGRLMSTVPGVDKVVEAGQMLPRLTHYVPMLSLPYLFKTELDSIPKQIPYMIADPILVDHWKQKLSWVDGPKVGLVWAGNPGFLGDHRRSPGFAAYQALLNIPGITFFSLQKGDGAKELASRSLPNNFFDLGHDLESWDDTAAAIMNMDLVISSCTSPAHLAGALGKPVWIVLSSFPDWRWFRQGEQSPWYPSARLFRQELNEPWAAVLDRVAHSLAQARQ